MQKEDGSLTNFVLNLLSHCRDIVEQGQRLVHALVDHTEVRHHLLEDNDARWTIFAMETAINKTPPPPPLTLTIMSEHWTEGAFFFFPVSIFWLPNLSLNLPVACMLGIVYSKDHIGHQIPNTDASQIPYFLHKYLWKFPKTSVRHF